MKATNTTELLLKTIDIELKKMLQQDLQAYRTAQVKKQSIQQVVKQAA
ncbi:hypothetical protein LLH06_14780 [Mucilaginibacter daejeonensis]|nr:hypothetical protein [Mucilaginibacter daejeonensis]UEG52230.1 hypothetical protein LLH06_14780 [Mucilaginibacter daejeonensis]